MAELLIKARNATHPNPDKDRMCYKRGDIVDVRPDGFLWGREECLPRFVIIKIPGLNPDTVRAFMKVHLDTSDPTHPVMLRRRLWGITIDASDIPTWVKTSLRNTGSVTVTVSQIRNFIKNKVTLDHY